MKTTSEIILEIEIRIEECTKTHDKFYHSDHDIVYQMQVERHKLKDLLDWIKEAPKTKENK